MRGVQYARRNAALGAPPHGGAYLVKQIVDGLMKPESPNMVCVQWRDSVGTSGWQPHFDGSENLNCLSCGFLWSEDKDRVIIHMNDSDWGGGDFMSIPRECVVEIIPLEKKISRRGKKRLATRV